MQLASAAKYVYGELIHEFYHAPSYRMEFSIPRDDHLLANVYRAIYNTHPWGECMVEVHEINEFRRFGHDKYWDLKYNEVYRVDGNNKSGLVDELEAEALRNNGIDPESLLVSYDAMGGLLYKSPKIWNQTWSERFVPKRGSVDLGQKGGSKSPGMSNGSPNRNKIELAVSKFKEEQLELEGTKVEAKKAEDDNLSQESTDEDKKKVNTDSNNDMMKMMEEMKKMFEERFTLMEKKMAGLEEENKQLKEKLNM